MLVCLSTQRLEDKVSGYHQYPHEGDTFCVTHPWKTHTPLHTGGHRQGSADLCLSYHLKVGWGGVVKWPWRKGEGKGGRGDADGGSARLC